MAEQQPTPKRRKKTELEDDDLYITIDSGSGKSYVIDEELVQFSLSIPNKLLLYWKKKCSENLSYIPLANSKILGTAAKLRENNPRIEDRLAQQARKVSKDISRAAGRRRDTLMNKHYHLVVMKNETESFTQIAHKLQNTCDILTAKQEQIEGLLKEMADLSNEHSEDQTSSSSPPKQRENYRRSFTLSSRT